MCNFNYKVISRILVNRIKMYPSSLVTSFQSVFVSDKLIHDNIFIVDEVFYHLEIKNCGKKEE